MWIIELTLIGGGRERLRYKTKDEAARIADTMPNHSTWLGPCGWDDDCGRTVRLAHGTNLVAWSLTTVAADETAAAEEEWIRSAGRGTTTEPTAEPTRRFGLPRKHNTPHDD